MSGASHMAVMASYSRSSPIQFGDSDVSGTDTNSYSFTALTIATAASDGRVCYVWIFNSVAGTTEADAEPSSVTIGGVTATRVLLRTRVVTNAACVSLYAARVPTGAAATVVVGFPVTQRRCGCILASAISPSLTPPLSGVLTASGTTDISGTVTIPNGIGFIGVHGLDNSAGKAFTFSGAGAVEVVDSLLEGGTQIAAATIDSTGTLTIAAANDAGMDAIWAAW